MKQYPLVILLLHAIEGAINFGTPCIYDLFLFHLLRICPYIIVSVCLVWKCIRVNPRLTGGGVWRPPPSRIFAIAQKRTALSTWNLAGLLIQQFDIVRGNFFEIRRKIFEIWSILWRHYTPLLVENWPNFAGLWKTQFLIKTQMKNTKRRKMRSSTRWLSRFFKILGFWPLKFQKIDFFGKWSLKSKIFKIFKKPEHMLFIY